MSRYDYSDGPALVDDHSLTKHQVLVDYLVRYFLQRTLTPGMERFRITLVDGFCGAGVYRRRSNREVVDGSPLRILTAVEDARAAINAKRIKPLELDVQYVFIDKDPQAVKILDHTLRERGYGAAIGASIHIVQARFAEKIDFVLDQIRRHTPQAGKAIFFLDQYGYTAVPAPVIRRIFDQCPSAEVVLTFHVASFATYSNDDLAKRISKTLHIDILEKLGGRSIDDLKASESDWRRFIQAALYSSLVEQCGATYFTPFFIRGAGSGHGEYWLVHLSRHFRAQDVMKQVHWQHSNHFVHYGGAGLDMLAPHTMGFLQQFDGGFRFDDIAKSKSDEALTAQLAEYVFNSSAPKTFSNLFAETCNGSPATATMYKEALANLLRERSIEIHSADGRRRKGARYITDTDVIEQSRQLRIFMP